MGLVSHPVVCIPSCLPSFSCLVICANSPASSWDISSFPKFITAAASSCYLISRRCVFVYLVHSHVRRFHASSFALDSSRFVVVYLILSRVRRHRYYLALLPRPLPLLPDTAFLTGFTTVLSRTSHSFPRSLPSDGFRISLPRSLTAPSSLVLSSLLLPLSPVIRLAVSLRRVLVYSSPLFPCHTRCLSWDWKLVEMGL